MTAALTWLDDFFETGDGGAIPVGTGPRTVDGGVETVRALNLGTSTDIIGVIPVGSLPGALGQFLVVRGVVTANVANRAAFTVAGNDGLTYAQGDRVLLTGQSTAAQNGVYIVGVVATGTAPLVLASDWATGHVGAETWIVVSEGTTNAHTAWRVTTQGAIVVGTTALTIAAVTFGAAAPAQAGQFHTARVVATSNVTLSAPQTIDGVSAIADDRVLLVGQTAPAENGLWLVKAGAWVRPTDWATGYATGDAVVRVSEGTLGAHTAWYVATQGAITVDTTSVSITQVPLPQFRTVRLAATTNLALTGTQTIDSVSAVAGDRVLLTAQTSAPENGIWVVSAGAWARPTDWTGQLVQPDAITRVSAGTINAHSAWYASASSGTITVGTTAVTLTKIGGLDISPDGTAVLGATGTSGVFAMRATEMTPPAATSGAGVARKWQGQAAFPSSGAAGGSVQLRGGDGDGAGARGKTLLGDCLELDVSNNQIVTKAAVSNHMLEKGCATPIFYQETQTGDNFAEPRTTAAQNASATATGGNQVGGHHNIDSGAGTAGVHGQCRLRPGGVTQFYADSVECKANKKLVVSPGGSHVCTIGEADYGVVYGATTADGVTTKRYDYTSVGTAEVTIATFPIPAGSAVWIDIFVLADEPTTPGGHALSFRLAGHYKRYTGNTVVMSALTPADGTPSDYDVTPTGPAQSSILPKVQVSSTNIVVKMTPWVSGAKVRTYVEAKSIDGLIVSS